MSGTIIPTLRYENVDEAISFLVEAFGFSEHMVSRTEDGSIAHAQLCLGSGMIMVGPVGNSEFDRWQTTPSKTSGKVTQSAYIVIEEVDKHHAQAIAGGAQIAEPLQNPPYGGRFYSCFDIENHLWNFGSYDPWNSD